jgi:hypothetical protein
MDGSSPAAAPDAHALAGAAATAAAEWATRMAVRPIATAAILGDEVDGRRVMTGTAHLGNSDR